MAKTAAQLAQENTALRAQLTPANKTYYESLMVYIRAQAVGKDELAVEQELLAILTDILAAQQDGRTAEAYFGKNPQETADDILAALPNKWRDLLNLVLYAGGACILLMALPMMIDPAKPVDVGAALFIAAYCLIIIVLLSRLFGQSRYGRPLSDRTANWLLIGFLLPGILFGLLMKTAWRFYFPGVGGIILIFAFLLIVGIVFWRKEKKNWKDSLIFLVPMNAIIGIIQRIPAGNRYFNRTPNGRYVILAAFGVLFIVYYILVWWFSRRHRSR